MILLSGRKSSVNKPSQHTKAALGDPQGGEIPMRLMHNHLLCSQLGEIEDKY